MRSPRAILYIQYALISKIRSRKNYNSRIFLPQPLMLLCEKKSGQFFALFTDDVPVRSPWSLFSDVID